jgi:3'-phosphoadenosine 5'-phosphosulfate (PAPS) 3'-phosphatase
VPEPSAVAGIERIRAEAVEAARQAGDLIVRLSVEGAYEVHAKHGTEIVTTADLRADAIIREHLRSNRVIIPGGAVTTGPDSG